MDSNFVASQGGSSDHQSFPMKSGVSEIGNVRNKIRLAKGSAKNNFYFLLGFQ